MLLDIAELRVQLPTPTGLIEPVSQVSFALEEGETLAIVGESGSGKTLTALSILGLLPPGSRLSAKRLALQDQELLRLSNRRRRRVQGESIGMVFQEPMTSLNPLLRVGEQIAEPLQLHRGMSRRAARRRAVELLERVEIPSAAARQHDYPHQMSGGMRQRVMIAVALACEPRLLIADEPTTALDVTVQARILALLKTLQTDAGMGMLFISHNLAVVAQVATRVAVMYSGRIVEQAMVQNLLNNPRHPYTAGLLRGVPRVPTRTKTAARYGPDTRGAPGHLPVIPGEIPQPHRRPLGCAFHPRCDRHEGDPKCRAQPPTLEPIGAGHTCACWHPEGPNGA